MILVERSGRVDAPVEEVWAVVRQAERLSDWLAGVQQVDVLSGEGVGRRQWVHAADGRMHDAEVIAWREPTLIGWRERAEGVGARAQARTETHVELAAAGETTTTVRLVVARWPPGPVSGALQRLGARRVGASLETSLARLAELMRGAAAKVDGGSHRASGSESDTVTPRRRAEKAGGGPTRAAVRHSHAVAGRDAEVPSEPGRDGPGGAGSDRQGAGRDGQGAARRSDKAADQDPGRRATPAPRRSKNSRRRKRRSATRASRSG